MDKRYSTIIFTPRDGRKFMKLKVSHRLIFSLISLITSALMLSLFFTVQYYRSVQQAEFYSNATKASRALEEELVAANAQMVRSMRNIEAASAQLVQQRRDSEKRLEELQHRYESLRALADGQEKIAAAHRAILEQRPLRQRLWEQATAFLVGVLSSLVATFVWVIAKSRTVNRNDDGLEGMDV